MKFFELFSEAPRHRVKIVILANLFYMTQLYLNWPFIHLAGFRGFSRYIDLNSILKSADCFQENKLGIYSDISMSQCDGYMYGRELIFFIQNLELTPAATSILGTSLTLLAMVLISWLVLIAKSSNWLATIVIFTPGLSLLLERGNFDVVVFILVTLAAIALNNNLNILTYSLLVASALLKFYTLPLLFLAVVLMKMRNAFKYGLMVCSLFISYDLFKQIGNLPKLPGTWFISFGSGVFGEYINLILRLFDSDVVIRGIGINIIGIFVVAGSFLFYAKKASKLIKPLDGSIDQQDKNLSVISLFSFIVFLSCYLTGISYDYRMIFYSISLLGFSQIWTISQPKLKVMLILSLVCTIYFPPSLINLRVIFQVIGDVSMLIIVPVLTHYYFEFVRKNLGIGKRND
jgi:hypothetical protein